MRDFTAYVRRHLQRSSLPPERDDDIVEELAAELEGRYASRLQYGESDEDAGARRSRRFRPGFILRATLRRPCRPAEPTSGELDSLV
jgi:hypothetical protein